MSILKPILSGFSSRLNSSLIPLTFKLQPIFAQQTRSLFYYYDRNTSQRHTCPDSLKRFFRLRWGGWIRGKAGGKRKLWRKPWYMRWYLRQHIMLNEEESDMAEKLITPKYKRPRYYIDDIYDPYHKRNNFDVCPAGQNVHSTSYAKLVYRE